MGTTPRTDVSRRRRLDPDAAKAWVEHDAGFERRTHLDARTRSLVSVAQHAIRRDDDALERSIRGALAGSVPARDVLEVLLQMEVYGGSSVTEPALATFERVISERPEHAQERPRPGGRAATSREEPDPLDPTDLSDPRYERLVRTHEREVVEAALRLRPRHHLDMLDFLDALDDDAARLWLAYVYGHLYARRVLDERTRLLCVVGACVAANEVTQARAHMAGAMRAGATPREVLEVILQSSRAFGQPLKVRFLAHFVDLMAEQGRLAEIGDPPRPRPEWLR